MIVVGILCIVVGVLLAAIGVGLALQLYAFKKSMLRLVKTQGNLLRHMEGIATATSEMSSNFAPYHAGLVAMAEAMIKSTTALELSMEGFRSVMFQGDETPGLQAYDSRKAQQSFDHQQSEKTAHRDLFEEMRDV